MNIFCLKKKTLPWCFFFLFCFAVLEFKTFSSCLLIPSRTFTHVDIQLVKPNFVSSRNFSRISGGKRIVRKFPGNITTTKLEISVPFLVFGIRISELNSTFSKLFPYHLPLFRQLRKVLAEWKTSTTNFWICNCESSNSKFREQTRRKRKFWWKNLTESKSTTQWNSVSYLHSDNDLFFCVKWSPSFLLPLGG